MVKKRTMNRQRFVLILLAGIVAGYRLVYKADEEFVFDDIINSGIIVVASMILLWAIVTDFIDYRKSPAFKILLPAITGLVLLAGISGSVYMLNQRDNTPSILL
jgi:hypothetical protein